MPVDRAEPRVTQEETTELFSVRQKALSSIELRLKRQRKTGHPYMRPNNKDGLALESVQEIQRRIEKFEMWLPRRPLRVQSARFSRRTEIKLDSASTSQQYFKLDVPKWSDYFPPPSDEKTISASSLAPKPSTSVPLGAPQVSPSDKSRSASEVQPVPEQEHAHKLKRSFVPVPVIVSDRSSSVNDIQVGLPVKRLYLSYGAALGSHHIGFKVPLDKGSPLRDADPKHIHRDGLPSTRLTNNTKPSPCICLPLSSLNTQSPVSKENGVLNEKEEVQVSDTLYPGGAHGCALCQRDALLQNQIIGWWRLFHCFIQVVNTQAAMCRDLLPLAHAGLFLHLHTFLESESGAVVFNSWVVTR
ncbi:protein FAM102A [Triplophysa rosa]|uniref:Protein FAM102A n=1 Tax=Triplophysa rosa TaxID=992332 RepID=A0A9W7X2I0_TRIRA|nr:protein FAM102A [Triplophysa rosa]